jgi:hypothetical protein
MSLSDVDLGNSATARRALEFATATLFARPRDGRWLPAMAVAALVAARLQEPAAAARLYQALPYRAQVIVAALPAPVVCFGSASLYLALLATVASRRVEAGDHFEAAMAVHERLGAGPLLARTRLAYASMLLAHGQPADRRRADELLEQALATAGALGMAAVAGEGQALQAGGTSQGPATARHVGVAGNVFRREGEYWTVGYEGSVVRLRDSKGLRHLARLLAEPGRELLATDLEAAEGQASPAGPSGRADDAELTVRPDLGDAGALLDATAKAAYKARLVDLQSELEEAERFNDLVRATRLREELDFLIAELARAVGLDGRDRRAVSHAERARLNTTRAIRTAMANLARANPALGQHLASAIRTGRYCSYIPDPRAPITWET